ncbi:MAG: hypothetical protein RMJ81_05105 [Candidatus Kryptonium sp.]|nr:YjbH domain-containing protein [Candidatus Kryptonium sp.]MCX7762296.1 YjbH domain-containing protein [Candidatus Kryptonium sp.]MDW8109018.1 hypothetical protein [Candidatus Kryptonium sp.]
MKKAFVVIFLLLLTNSLLSQGSAGAGATFQQRFIVDMPTAGLLRSNSVSLDADFFADGGLMLRLNASAFNRLNFGISYGGSKIIGNGNVNWYKLPGVNLKIRIIDETKNFPAIAIGFDSQGREKYVDSLKRYEFKSPGFFIVGSKSFIFLGYASVHGGINYSLEKDDGDKSVNYYIGFDKTIGNDLTFSMEYNFAINDNSANALGSGKGYLNAGIRWSLGSGFTIEFNWKDILRNKEPGNSRVVKLEYIQSF